MVRLRVRFGSHPVRATGIQLRVPQPSGSVWGWIAIACVGASLLSGCGNHAGSGNTASSGSGAAASTLTIAVIPKGTTHQYWNSVKAGADAAGKDLGVNIEWKGPVLEDDRAGQIQIVQQFVSDNVSGIVLAPLDENALVSPVRAAAASKIPVVIIDSALKATPGQDFVSFVATDNHKGGYLGGERLAQLLGGKGKVILLRYMEGSASTEAREAGFEEAIHKYPGITILSDTNYAGATQGEAQTKAMQMVDEIKQADGIFCPNESSTMGMLQALKQDNLTGKLKFVGFDASPPLIDALKAKQIDALVAQNPTRMGYEGVQSVVAAIQHQTVAATIDTGVTVIDNSNIGTPDVQKLLAGS